MSDHFWLKMQLAAMLVIAVSRGTASARDYRTYVVRPAINNNAILDGEALPIECRDTTVMKVLCARGEYEPASFLVETDTLLKQVLVNVSPLKGTAGVLGSETVDRMLRLNTTIRNYHQQKMDELDTRTMPDATVE